MAKENPKKEKDKKLSSGTDDKKRKPGDEKKAKDKPAAKADKKAAASAQPAAGGDMKCSACGGALVDYDDYVFFQKLRRAAACIPSAIAICVAWTLLFIIVRLAVGGSLFSGGGGALAALLLKKVFVGAILGAILGAIAGIWGTDVGLFIGVVAGSLGGFFVAAAPESIMPLLPDAAHRADIVIAAIGGGILSGATVLLAYKKGAARAKYIGPEPKEQQDDAKASA